MRQRNVFFFSVGARAERRGIFCRRRRRRCHRREGEYNTTVRIRGDHINRPDIWSTKFPERRGSILIKNGAHLDAVAATPGPRDILYYYCDVAGFY